MADPIPEEFLRKMRAICAGVDEVFNGPPTPGRKPVVAFAILTAHFDDIEDGQVNYMANCDRASMLALMREYLARAEGRYAKEGRG